MEWCRSPSFHDFTLPQTNSSPLKIGHLTQKGNYRKSSNHPFSGAKMSETTVVFQSSQIQGRKCPVSFREGKKWLWLTSIGILPPLPVLPENLSSSPIFTNFSQNLGQSLDKSGRSDICRGLLTAAVRRKCDSIDIHPRNLIARPWKVMVGKWVSFWVWYIFRGYVKFPGCKCMPSKNIPIFSTYESISHVLVIIKLCCSLLNIPNQGWVTFSNKPPFLCKGCFINHIQMPQQHSNWVLFNNVFRKSERSTGRSYRGKVPRFVKPSEE